LLIGQLIGSPVSIKSGNLFACALHSNCPSECHASYRVNIGGRFCPQNWLPWQHPLMDRKNDLRLFIYGQSFASPANFVKIGVVDDELIGLTEITKNIFLN